MSIPLERMPPEDIDRLKLRHTNRDGSAEVLCPDCNGNEWRAVKNPRLGPGIYEVRCDRCNGYGWIDQEHEVRP